MFIQKKESRDTQISESQKKRGPLCSKLKERGVGENHAAGGTAGEKRHASFLRRTDQDKSF